MINSKRILYIGNNLSKKTNYNTTMSTLSALLVKEKFKVLKSSSLNNKFFRLLDMCFSVIRNRNKVDFIFIDTFSTINFYYAFLTSQLSRLLGIRYIPILHGGNLPYRLDRSRTLSKMIFNNSYYNIAPSNYLKKEFEKRGFKTSFIPNILEIDKYAFKERKRLQPKLFWVRAFKHLYNPTLAVEVLNLVKKEFSDAKLCMVGPHIDTSFEETKKLAEKLDLLNYIEFTGVLPRKDWHKKSKDFDIFINTTNFDNTPVSVMEAMALGMPIVSTNVGGLPFLIENGKDGILVEKQNAELMAKQIILLLEKGALDIVISARSKAETFAWNNVKEKWFSILN